MRPRFVLQLIAAVVATGTAGALVAHAVNYPVVDLTPPGSTNAQALRIFDGQPAGFSDDAADNSHAWLWTATGGDLHPTGLADSSQISGISAQGQVGTANIGPHGHAAMWTGTVISYQRLNEVGYSGESSAVGISGGIVTGTGLSEATSQNQALVWIDPTNLATAPVALATPGTFGTFHYVASTASAIDGSRVAGFATMDDPLNLNHAAVWNISAIPGGGSSTFTDIHPAGFTDSFAASVSGNNVIGFGDETASGLSHALLWQLSPTDSVLSLTDLNPAGFDQSVATDGNGGQEVGFAVDASGNAHAMLWNGTADSFLDLSTFLPAGFVSSEAFGIDQQGAIVGMAIDEDGNTHAILWVPEPATATLMIAAAAILLIKPRRSHVRSTALRLSFAHADH